MLKVLKESNKIILIVSIIVSFYYYRVCNRMIQNVEGDHIDLFLHLFMLLSLIMGLLSSKGKRIRSSSLAKCVLAWIFLISFGSLLNWIDSSSFITTLLWCVYFLVVFIYYSSDSDEAILQISSLVICIITLIAGFLSMGVVAIVNQAASVSGEYDEFLNIIGFTVTTIPAIMTLKNKPLQWAIYLGVVIVSIVTARRLALVIVTLIIIISLVDLLRKKNRRWYTIPLILIAFFFAFTYVSTTFSDSIQIALGRLTKDSLTASNETGDIRVQLWSDVFRAISQSDLIELILGHGSFGVFTVTHHTAAHNDFLEMFFDYGVIGLSFFIALHVFLIKRTYMFFKRKSDYRFSYMMSYFILLLYGSFGNVLLYADYCLPLVIYWGYMEAKLSHTSSSYSHSVSSNVTA